MTRLTTTYRNGLRRMVLASALNLALLAAFGAGALAGDLAVGARYDLGDNQAMPSRLSALAVAQEYGVPARVVLRPHRKVAEELAVGARYYNQAMPSRLSAHEVAQEYGVPVRVLLRPHRHVESYVSLFIEAMTGNEIARENLALMPRFMTPVQLAWAQKVAEVKWAEIQRNTESVVLAEAGE